MNILKHNIDPIFDKNSKILMLGSFPSPKSRELVMYYGNPQNRMWKVLSKVFNEDIPANKKSFLLRHNIAMWDVLKSCQIKGASDSTIKNAKPNNLKLVIDNANILAVFTTGVKAAQLYKKYNSIDLPHIKLPSTSPANAAWSLDNLVEAYTAKFKNFLPI